MIDTKVSTSTCKFVAGIMIPVIDPMRCEAAGPAPMFGRLKLFVHGGQQAFALHPDSCHGCELCVQGCPEKAIKLQKAAQSASPARAPNFVRRCE